jgi:peptide/nickel transport system permease protein
MKISDVNINANNKYSKVDFFLKLLYALKKLSRRNLVFVLGTSICVAWVIVALFAYLIIPYDPISQNLEHRFESPNSMHWFGTDVFGRDVLSRVIVGGRISILAGVLTVFVCSVTGTLFGGVAGFMGGIFDDIMMRISEMFSAFPALILAMTITAALGPNLFNTLLALSIVSWPPYARVMRSMAISIKENEYIEAAKALGASNTRILLKEILPNGVGSVLVLATLDIGNQILRFAGLSYLGLGSPPPTPEWGAMVAEGSASFGCWWITLFPGLAILTIALGANFVGDGVRDYLDPKLRKEF